MLNFEKTHTKPHQLDSHKFGGELPLLYCHTGHPTLLTYIVELKPIIADVDVDALGQCSHKEGGYVVKML